MKFLQSLAMLAISSLSFFSCTEKTVVIDPLEATAPVSLHFKALFGDEPLVMLQPYTYADTAKIVIGRVNYYLNNVRLVKADNTEVPIADLIDVDFTQANASLAGATAGIEKQFANIPVGTYKAIKFGVGLDSLTNSKSPDQFPADSPLSQTANYWDAWGSYIFSKLEGRADYNHDNIFEAGFAYHTGTNALYYEYTKTQPITITKSSTTANKIQLHLDVQNIFYDTNGAINIAEHPSSHSPNEIHFAEHIIKQLAASLAVE